MTNRPGLPHDIPFDYSPDGTMLVFATDRGSSDLATLDRWCADRQSGPVIIAGDFNDWGEKLDVPMTDCDLYRATVPGEEPTAAATWMP